MPAFPNDARAAAWEALRLFDEGRIERLADALDGELLATLEPREAALARELVLGVARHQRLYDAVAAMFLRPGEQPPALLRTLRLAAHQLFGLDRIPPHAVGSTMVDLLRAQGGSKLTGVANAVIRKLVALRREERDGEGPLGRLEPRVWPRSPAVRHGLPDLLVRDLAAQLGDQPDAALAALNRQPHLCTRRRAGRPLPRGRSLLREDGEWQWWSDPHEVLAGPVADGLCAVQDRAQGHPVEIARPRPLELVLDLCAAPGGKALALADVGCRVIAADLMASRLAVMRAQLPGQLVANDGRKPALAEGAFDLVLVDAPCSNTGVLARRPEARWRYDDQHLASLAELQHALLASAARLVAHDGRMVYATCSVSPRENQAIAHSLPGWRLLAERSTWPDEWQAGGYAALLVRA